MACAIVAQALLGLSINCKALQHTQCLLVPPTLLPRNHRPLLLGDLVHCLRTVRNRDFLSVSVQDLRQFASTALFHSRLLRRSGGGIEMKTIQNLCAGHIQWSRLCARTYFAVLHFLLYVLCILCSCMRCTLAGEDSNYWAQWRVPLWLKLCWDYQ